MSAAPHEPPPDRNPYADAAPTYWAAGWRGILPIPPRTKKLTLTGWTGNDGAWPSYPDVQAWTEDTPDHNIALRLPPNVLGIDVDAYGTKAGGLVFNQLEQDHGRLPATWRTTSRDDGVSGIRLYRIPEGLRWPGVLGPGIETIRTGHRYALAWPSIHPEGGTYRWITPDGNTSLHDVPTPDDLPYLPAAWVDHFTAGVHATDQARANLPNAAAGAWLQQHGAGAPCAALHRVTTRGLGELATAGSRHDHMLGLTNRLVWLAGEGHPGATASLEQARAAFTAATAGDRTSDEVAGEWDRMVTGAVQLAAAAHPNGGDLDPCTNPLAGLINPKEQPCPPPTTPGPSTAPAAATAATAAPVTSPAAPATSTEAPSSSDTSTSAPGADAPGAAPRSSWWPVALHDALAGHREPPPAHLTRTDGHAAFYAGRVNGIIGPSESGKTWVAMHAVRQAVESGANVTVLDFEDTATGVIGRLLGLGVDPDLIRDHVAYINPGEAHNQFMPSGLDLTEHLAEHDPELVILDGFNASMSLQGLNLLDNMDATRFFQNLLKPIAETGACVVYIDHTPKDKENTSSGGIGAQAKRAMTTGCTLKVDVVKAFGKGQTGKLRLYVDKDRQGDVRGISAPSNASHWFGDFDVIGHTEGTLDTVLHQPDGFDPARPHAERDIRPTVLMEKVSRWIADQDEPPTTRAIREAGLGRKKEYVIKALELLVTDGYVRAEETTGRGGKRVVHHLVTPYSQDAELLGNTPQTEAAPSGPQVAPGPVSKDPDRSGPPAPSPYGEPGPLPSPSEPTENDALPRSEPGATSAVIECSHCAANLAMLAAAHRRINTCWRCEQPSGWEYEGRDAINTITGEVITP